jgi:membrane protease YdiL (CAAX protease family)
MEQNPDPIREFPPDQDAKDESPSAANHEAADSSEGQPKQDANLSDPSFASNSSTSRQEDWKKFNALIGINGLPAVPWSPRDVWIGMASILLWFAIIILIQLVARKFKVDAGVMISLSEVLLLVPVAILALFQYRSGWSALGLRSFRGQAVGIGCGLMVVFYAFNLCYSLLLALFRLRVQTDIVPLISKLPSPVWFFIGGALVAPFVQEILFRGFIFGGLRGHYGFWKAAIISAVVFGAVHLQLTSFLPITLLGLIFAFLYERSRSIWPSILMHFLTNACSLTLAFYLSQIGTAK